jgi:ssDNA-binding Zn-finger/Zn-ribbon topoisomerase 1
MNHSLDFQCKFCENEYDQEVLISCNECGTELDSELDASLLNYSEKKDNLYKIHVITDPGSKYESQTNIACPHCGNVFLDIQQNMATCSHCEHISSKND